MLMQLGAKYVPLIKSLLENSLIEFSKQKKKKKPLTLMLNTQTFSKIRGKV